MKMEFRHQSVTSLHELPGAVQHDVRQLMIQVVTRMRSAWGRHPIDHRFRVDDRPYISSLPQKMTNFDDHWLIEFAQAMRVSRDGTVIDEVPTGGFTYAVVDWLFDGGEFNEDQMKRINVRFFDPVANDDA